MIDCQNTLDAGRRCFCSTIAAVRAALIASL
jgi:hypothetical protein